MRFKLRIIAGKGTGREFVFSQKKISIGRLPDNDLVLYDTGVSRVHCTIHREEDAFVLRDLGSANGTLVNETLATESHIFDGDQIQVGPVIFEFSSREETSLDPAPAALHAVAWKAENDAQKKLYEEMDTRAYEIGDALTPPPPAPAPAPSEGDGDALTETGSYRARRKSRLPSKRVMAIAAVILVAGAALSWFVAMRDRGLKDRSDEVFRISETNEELRFGAGKVDVVTLTAANFAFDYGGGKATLSYAVGGTETDDEIAIELNGKRIGHAPASPGKWTTDVSLDFPSELLNEGRNVVTFRHRPLAGTKPRWGVARLKITESSVPNADPDKAEHLFSLGKSAFDTRSVAPQNLARSIEYFREAILFLEALEQRPPLYYDIQKSRKRAEKLLQEVFDSHLFAAEQALRFGDRRRAIESLRDLLQYLVDPEDPRREVAKARLDELLDEGRVD